LAGDPADRAVDRAVIVLGAAGAPARARRARHAAALVRAGRAGWLVATGGGAEAADLARAAQAAGVPAGRIVTERRAANTLQNAVLTAGLLRRRGLLAGALVTDWPHLPRAWLCLRLAGVACRPAPVPGTVWRPRFWLRELGAGALYLVWVPRLLRVRRRAARPAQSARRSRAG
jgi:uncharacterized SAM-binding protein YcdF (DUF218 family)